MDINTRDAIVILKLQRLSNSEIARQLNVSRQYVSRICNSASEKVGQSSRSANTRSKQGWKPGDNELLSVGAASRLLGVSPQTVRRWSDTQQIPSFRLEIGRKDRRFKVTELQRFITGDMPPENRSLES